MTEIVGATVTARVVRVEPYGLWLAYGEATILVLVIDVSERPIHLLGAYRVGDEVRVQVLRFVAERGVYKGAMVELHSELPDWISLRDADPRWLMARGRGG